jgi:fucose 4-O-acetylase-like acetyltransferase
VGALTFFAVTEMFPPDLVLFAFAKAGPEANALTSNAEIARREHKAILRFVLFIGVSCSFRYKMLLFIQV